MVNENGARFVDEGADFRNQTYAKYGREMLRITPNSEVLDTEDEVIPGLYADGELVGGLLYQNCPARAGLMAGSVFVKVAGQHAAVHATGVRR